MEIIRVITDATPSSGEGVRDGAFWLMWSDGCDSEGTVGSS